jgi:hypothetical protein
MPYASWDTTIISKMGPMIIVGSAKAQGSKEKPTNRVRATQSNQSEGRSDTKGGQQLAHPVPHRGDLTSSSFVSESQSGGLRPFVWAGIEPSEFSASIT